MIDQVVLGFTALSTCPARPPVFPGRFEVHIYYVLPEITRGGVDSTAVPTLRLVFPFMGASVTY